MHRFLRYPKTPHEPGHRMVPVAGCGCSTCATVRRDNLLDDAHGAKVANLLDIEERGACACGRSLDEHGICLAGDRCELLLASAHRDDAQMADVGQGRR